MNSKKRFVVGNRGQIWVETVIYTLIAFSLMGLVLAFVVPKIKEIQDKGIIEQSKTVLNDIDSLIREIRGEPGNQRILELGMDKGSLTIDAINDRIFFELESKYQYSQPGENVSEGRIIANTQEKRGINLLTLTLNYTGENNLTYQGQETNKTITRAPIPYTISIADTGKDEAGNPIINIEVQ